MDPQSAFRPDGFPGLFFQHYWDIAAVDVILGVQHFFKDSNLLPNLNSSFIGLLPKGSDANSILHYRPITLANFFFKIITKVLASRLGCFIGKIISRQQSAFIPGQSIHDCITLVA